MNNKFKKILINLGVLVLTLILIFVVLEIAVRIFTKPIYPILHTDEKVGTIHQKNFDDKIWNDESATWNYIKTNSLGYVGDEIEKEKRPNTIRIAFLGDSMVEALQTDYYNNFVSKLNTALDFSSEKKFEVLNFGVGGSGTFLQYQTYKHNVAPLDPDAVFVVFHSNDYYDNLNKISFDLENYAGERTRRVWLKDFLLRFQLPKFAFVKLQHNLFFLEVLNKFGLYELNDNFRNRRNDIDITQNDDYYEYTFSIIKKLKNLIEENNADFYMVLLPYERDYLVEGFCESDKNSGKIIEFLEKEDIKYLNSCQQLYQAREKYSVEECFNFSCSAGHLTELGHQEFAKILYQYIIKNYGAF